MAPTASSHPGGTLGAHLERVQVRLARLGARPAVQLAARAHAVYGTDGFDVRLLGLDERPLLAALIGAEAEELGPAALRDFADLSLVNEMDVAEHAPRFLDRHGECFRRLTRAWAPLLSPSVAAEAARVFG